MANAALRYPVEPRDVPPIKAARRLHLTLAEFQTRFSDLRSRGFPAPDPTTGNFDLKAIDLWMDNRSGIRDGLTPTNQAKDARAVAKGRLGQAAWRQ